MGFSDIGCFGSEIPTPNIDALAGMRFTQMYNCGRCCPSRASILTGIYPHQAGIGHMVYDAKVGPAYQGYLRRRDDVPTIAELLKKTYQTDGGEVGGGYATFMVGKWHVGGEYPPDATHDWIQSTMGDETHPTPNQRGFDQFFGTLNGGGSYFQPPSLVRDGKVIREIMPKDFYYTDEINNEACRMIEEKSKSNNEQPFFMYVAHTAPHWPLHAPKKEIDKHRGKYLTGWDVLRQKRHSRLVEQNLIPSTWLCSPRDERCQSWNEKDEKTKVWEDSRMAVYAAQITIMDEGIGRIVDVLRRTGMYENTVIFFLSDNGGCAEYLKENGEEGHWPEFYGGLTRDGKKIQVGNLQHLEPGEEDTFMSYDLSWANASNTPFRLFKSFVHEGGIATPFLVHWPAALSATEVVDDERICHSPWLMMDIVATCCELGHVPIPSTMEGESFLPVLRGEKKRRQKPLFWEHQGNCAVRTDKWKLVYRRCEEGDDEWELYDMDYDRTELYNLASQHKCLVEEITQMYNDWAERVGVKPWPLHPIPEDKKDWSNLPWLW
jgi:arylsulfatase